MSKYTLLLTAILAFLATACGTPTNPPATGGTASFEIVSPAEGATVAGPDVAIEIEVQNLTVQAPGGANHPNQGHFHYFVDNSVDYEVVYETTHVLTLSAGEHTVRVELRNNDHTSFNPPVVREVHLTVSGTAGSLPGTEEETPSSGYSYDY